MQYFQDPYNYTYGQPMQGQAIMGGVRYVSANIPQMRTSTKTGQPVRNAAFTRHNNAVLRDGQVLQQIQATPLKNPANQKESDSKARAVAYGQFLHTNNITLPKAQSEEQRLKKQAGSLARAAYIREAAAAGQMSYMDASKNPQIKAAWQAIKLNPQAYAQYFQKGMYESIRTGKPGKGNWKPFGQAPQQQQQQQPQFLPPQGIQNV